MNIGEAVLALISAVGPGGVAVALVVLGLLSQRLGAVTKMPPHYRWFYVAAGVVGGSGVVRLLGANAATDTFLNQLYVLFFMVGVVIGTLAAWRYWAWLFGESND